MNIDYNKLKTFSIVAKHGQLTAAARDLSRSQPAITTQIQILEEELGFNLLERRKGLVKLTPQGKELYEFAKTVFQNLDSKIASQQRSLGEPEGLLRVISLNDKGNEFSIAERLATYCKKFPKVRVDLSYGINETIEQDLIDGKFDVGLSVIFKNPKYFTRHPASLDKHNLYASVKYLSRVPKPTASTILDLDIVDISQKLIGFIPWYQKNFPKGKKRLSNFKAKITLPDYSAIFKVLEEGFGVGILPEYLVNQSPNCGLVNVLKAAKPTVSGLDIAIRNHRTLRACEAEFIKVCSNQDIKTDQLAHHKLP